MEENHSWDPDRPFDSEETSTIYGNQSPSIEQCGHCLDILSDRGLLKRNSVLQK